MKVLHLTQNLESRNRSLSRKEMARDFSIHFRDLRPVFIESQVATILARKNCIIINMGKIKVVFDAHTLFVFNIEDPLIKDKFIPNLIDFVRKNSSNTSFEFLILEFILVSKATQLKHLLEDLSIDVNILLKTLSSRVKDTSLEKLLKLKKRVSYLETTIAENEEASQDLMKDDEDLKLLYLSSKEAHIAVEDLNEVESILESFVEQMEVFGSKVNLLKEDIDDTQEIITLKLGNRRNTIIRLDLIATLATFSIALMTLFTGIFGMNLKNNLENSDAAFYISLAAISIVGLIVFLLGLKLFKSKKII